MKIGVALSKMLLVAFAVSFLSFQAMAGPAEEAKPILDKVSKVVSDAKKGTPFQTKVPTFDPNNWKVHVLAEEEIVNDNVEIPANSLVYVGKRMVTQKLKIHGDGILYVEGEVLCPQIDVRGNALVVFNGNKTRFFGGLIKIDSGVIIARKSNKLDVFIRNNGTLVNAGDNEGDIEGNGLINIYVRGNLDGSVKIGKGAGTRSLIDVAGKMNGDINSQQSLNINIKNDIEGDINVAGDLDIKLRRLIDSPINVSGTLVAKLDRTENNGKETLSIRANTAKIDIAKNNVYDILTKGNLALNVGSSNKAVVQSETGNVDLNVAQNQTGQVKAGNNLNLKAAKVDGSCIAGAALNLDVKGSLKSHLAKAGTTGKIRAKDFKGNIEIAGAGDIEVDTMRRGAFSHHVTIGSGKIKVNGLNELKIHSNGNADIFVKTDNRSDIKIVGVGIVNVGRSNAGKIIITKDATISVKNRQHGVVHVGGNGKKLTFGAAHRSVIVVGMADINIGRTVQTPYDASVIKIASGSIVVQNENVFDVETTTAKVKSTVSIGSKNNGKITMAGSADVKIVGDQTGEVWIADGGTYTTANQKGTIKFGNAMVIKIPGTLLGDLLVKNNTGKTNIDIGHIVDSNVAVFGICKLNTKEIIDVKAGEEKVFIKTGELLAAMNIEADFLAEGDMFLKAKKIYGNVDIGGKNSRVDAVVKGKLKVVQ